MWFYLDLSNHGHSFTSDLFLSCSSRAEVSHLCYHTFSFKSALVLTSVTPQKGIMKTSLHV